MQKTKLYEEHLALGAKMSPFAGWDMPLYYKSAMDEHLSVRERAGMFDVSHINVVDITGSDAFAFMQLILANDVSKLNKAGRAMYSCMLNEQGGVIDDLVIYYLGKNYYRVVANASRKTVDLEWLGRCRKSFLEAPSKVGEVPRSRCTSRGMTVPLISKNIDIKVVKDVAIIAVQGPLARDKVHTILPKEQVQLVEGLARFDSVIIDNIFIARTGYTGEDGYEIILSNNNAVSLWRKLLEVGVTPCGLVARDSLRLEAGFCLYGNDLDEKHTPFESSLDWTIPTLEREFIGKDALRKQREQGVKNKLVKLKLCENGVLRRGQKVIVENVGEGIITSGGFAPNLKCSIALARIPVCDCSECLVEVRGEFIKAQITG